MNTYLFHRAESFYPVELKDDADAIANAENNPGTVKVENALSGYVIWEAKRPHQIRVIEEKRALDEKRARLTDFTYTEDFDALPEDEQKRLNLQHAIMQQYSEVLGERIAAFQP